MTHFLAFYLGLWYLPALAAGYAARSALPVDVPLQREHRLYWLYAALGGPLAAFFYLKHAAVHRTAALPAPPKPLPKRKRSDKDLAFLAGALETAEAAGQVLVYFETREKAHNIGFKLRTRTQGRLTPLRVVLRPSGAEVRTTALTEALEARFGIADSFQHIMEMVEIRFTGSRQGNLVPAPRQIEPLEFHIVGGDYDPLRDYELRVYPIANLTRAVKAPRIDDSNLLPGKVGRTVYFKAIQKGSVKRHIYNDWVYYYFFLLEPHEA